MQVRDFVPFEANALNSQIVLDTKLKAIDSFLTKAGSVPGRSAPPVIGFDQLAEIWRYMQPGHRSQIMQELFILVHSVSELRSPIYNIKSEVFRKGIKWIPKFSVKCATCGKEHENIVQTCESCGGTELNKPDEKQKERLGRFMEECNVYGQSLQEVLGAVEDDANICDDAYILLYKEYKPGPNGQEDVRSRVKEIRRLNPAHVLFDLDEKMRPKQKHWVCPYHRGEEPGNQQVFESPGECNQCHTKLIPVMYTYDVMGKQYYLLDSEVIHFSKFSPSETIGFPAVLTVFQKALTLLGMDKTLFRYFFERKMPAAMVLTVTDDVASLRREREYVMTQLRQDPDYLPWIPVSSRSGARGRTDLVRLWHTLQEMDYLPVKQEIRERISAMFGVSPVWQAVSEAKGGIQQQTQELEVTGRIVEADQNRFNFKALPRITQAFGITDWMLWLSQPEEQAEMTRIQFAQQRTMIAQVLFNMGFDLEMKPGIRSLNDVDFIVSGKAQRQEMGGYGMGGFGGGYPGMGGEETPPEGEEESEEPIG